MVTLFTMPKPFRGHIATIQRNAIGSWVRLRPACHIILFGDEEGTAEIAKEFGVCHVPAVARNGYGTPLVSDLFEKAQRTAAHDLLCYVNSDIILMNDFVQAVERVSRWRKRFLMVGECWNADISERLPFSYPGWEGNLRAFLRRAGQARGPWAIDYFTFPRGLYEALPPFALGRASWDNWLIWKARALKAAVVDATRAVTAVHQNHDYAHVAGGKDVAFGGEEARRNLELAGGRKQLYLMFDATHRLGSAGFRRRLGGCCRVRFRWERTKRRTRRAAAWMRWGAMELTRPIRHPIGLRMATVERVKARLTRDR